MQGNPALVYSLLVALLCFFSILAVELRNLLYAILSLAVSSVVMAALFYLFGAFVASFFELIVIGGLITVLFVVTLSLTRRVEEDKGRGEAGAVLGLSIACAIIILLLTRVGLSGLLTRVGPEVTAGLKEVGELMWGVREVDVLGIIFIILAGVIGVLTLFKGERE